MMGHLLGLLSPVQLRTECEKRTPPNAFLFVGMKSALRSILHTNKATDTGHIAQLKYTQRYLLHERRTL